MTAEYELRPAEIGLLVSVEKEISGVREICRRALTKSANGYILTAVS